jgi:hypothetical protein
LEVRSTLWWIGQGRQQQQAWREECFALVGLQACPVHMAIP